MNNDAIKIVLEAQAEAGRLGQASVDTEHLLLGIIALQGISTSGLMTAFNINLPDARLKVERINGLEIHSTKDEISLPLTRLSEHVIERAWQVARNFHQFNLGPEHFLIALLDEKQGHASTILEALVPDSEELGKQCTQLCREASERNNKKPTEAASLTDIEQREMFYRSFPVEISNVLRYSLKKSEGLMMSTQITGAVLQASRCLLICKMPKQEELQYYEYCAPMIKQTCKTLQWPSRDSLLVSRAMLSKSLILYAEDENVDRNLREELRTTKTKSFFGASLQIDNTSYGCLVLQQCDRHRVWEDREIAFLQDVVERVARELAI